MLTQINDRTVAYDLAGRDGDWVCLAHAHCGSRKTWTALIQALSQTHRVLSFDARGHGQSTATEPPYSMAQLAQDAAELLSALGIEQTHWIGQAMGAMVGQALAISQPQRVKSLVLANSTLGNPEVSLPLWQARNAIARAQGLQALLQATLERWFTAKTLQMQPPWLQDVVSTMLGTPPDGYVGASLAMATMDQRDAIASISCPTLILVGDADTATPPSQARQIHAGIKNSTLLVLPDSAHMAYLEQPELFRNAVLDFLARRA